MSGNNKMLKNVWMPPRWAIWVLFLVLLIAPLTLRIAQGDLPIVFDDSYAALTESTLVAHNIIQSFDPFTNILAFFVSFGYPWILPLLLGLVTFFLLEKTLPALTDDVAVQRYALLLAAITPLMQSISISYTPLSLFFPVMLLGYWAYTHHTNWGDIIALVCFVVLPFILFEGAIVTLLVIFHAIFFRRTTFSVTLLVLSFFAIFSLVSYGWSFKPSILHPAGYFGEVGGLYGFSLFILLLAVMAVFLGWRQIPKGEALFFLVLLIVAIWYPGFRLVALLPLVMFAAVALIAIIRRDWAVPFLKQATLLLLGCLSLFVLLSTLQMLLDATPEAPLIAALNELDNQIEPGVLLTTEAYDGTASFLTQRQILKPTGEPGNSATEIYHAITLGSAAPWLNRENVRYILVTDEMREGDVWHRSDEGLLFLLTYNDKFIKIFSGDGYEIWLFLQEYA